MWSASSGGATGASVPGSSDTATFDAATCVGGVTCTITVNTTITIQTLTFGACTASTNGCILDFSVNNNDVNLTVGGLSGTGTGTRNFKKGSGIWTITAAGSGSIWNMGTTTGLTFSDTGSIVYNSTAVGPTFAGGGLSYNSVSFNVTGSGSGVILTGANTFATLLVGAGVTLSMPQGVTNTITNAFALNGTSSAPISMLSSTFGTVSTVSTASGSASCAWCTFHSMVFSGGATFTASNSLNLGGNTGISITPPSVGGAGGRIIGG